MEAKVLGLGNALVDILVRIPNDSILDQFGLPRGSMQLVEQERSQEIYDAIKSYNPQIVAGGSASNTINGLANLGVATGMIGKIGKNEIGELYKKDILNSGIAPVINVADSCVL